jgi:Integrase core domain
MKNPHCRKKCLLKTINEHNKIEILNEVQEQMGSYLFEYNHLRRHGGLNYETPFDKLQQVTELVS